MKILYFNWVPTRAFSFDGGGVSIYQKNLLNYFSLKKDVDVYYLTTSYAYDLIKKESYIRECKKSEIDGIHEFEIVNSPILAPSFFSFNKVSPYFIADKTIDVIDEFIRKIGDIDVIHFNNLEGISARVLELKQKYPRIKFVYSLHNYFPFCPQVNLWYRDKENCLDYLNGEKCKNCNLFPVDYNMKMFERSDFANLKHRKLSKIAGKIFSLFHQSEHFDSNPDFKFRRENYVKLINDNIDIVLCVSERVKKIAVKMGVSPYKCIVQYIGTKHADYASKFPNIISHNGLITMGYLGYMRRDKGFYFLLDTLEKIPQSLANSINIVIAAPITDKSAYNRLISLKSKFHSVDIFDGYRPENLKDILHDVNLGVVPVLWEDNLPQVALEFTAYGIPILTSDLGGAQEITMSNDFIFKAGDSDDFILKLSKIISNRNSLFEFWPNETEKHILTSVKNHCEDLIKIYGTK